MFWPLKPAEQSLDVGSNPTFASKEWLQQITNINF